MSRVRSHQVRDSLRKSLAFLTGTLSASRKLEYLAIYGKEPRSKRPPRNTISHAIFLKSSSTSFFFNVSASSLTPSFGVHFAMDRYPSLTQISPSRGSSEALGYFDFMRNLNAHSVQTPVKPGKPCTLSAQICRKIMENERTRGRKMDSSLSGPFLDVERVVDLPLTSSHVVERDTNSHLQAHKAYLVDVQKKPPHQIIGIKSSYSGTIVKNSSKYRKEQWIQQKPEIYKLYIKEGLQLSTVKARMDSNGFHAT